MIHITVTGLDEVTSLLQQNIREIPNLNKTVLTDIATTITDEMRKNAHVITGRMKASIYQNPPTELDIELGATAPYSVYENARQGVKAGYGPHNFADMAVATTAPKAWDIMVLAYNRLFMG